MLSLLHFMDDQPRLRIIKRLVLFPHLQNVPHLPSAEHTRTLTSVMKRSERNCIHKGHEQNAHPVVSTRRQCLLL